MITPLPPLLFFGFFPFFLFSSSLSDAFLPLAAAERPRTLVYHLCARRDDGMKDGPRTAKMGSEVPLLCLNVMADVLPPVHVHVLHKLQILV